MKHRDGSTYLPTRCGYLRIGEDVEAFCAPGEVLTRLALPLRAVARRAPPPVPRLVAGHAGLLPAGGRVDDRPQQQLRGVGLDGQARRHGVLRAATWLVARAACRTVRAMRLPLVTSHAACKGHAPENTLAGIETAIALGADAIEIDVHCTSDGVPVLIHDETVDRTTDGSGNVHEMPLGVVRKLDAGARQFAPQFAGERVPAARGGARPDERQGAAADRGQTAGHRGRGRAVRARRGRDRRLRGAFVLSRRSSRACASVEPRMAAALLTDGRRVVGLGRLLRVRAVAERAGGQRLLRCRHARTRARGQRRSLTFMTWTVDDDRTSTRMLRRRRRQHLQQLPGHRARRDRCARGAVMHGQEKARGLLRPAARTPASAYYLPSHESPVGSPQ